MKSILSILILAISTNVAFSSQCLQDEHVVVSSSDPGTFSCQACALDRTNAPGDDPEDLVTGSTACQCLQDEHVAFDDGSLSCAVCPGGRSNAPGDDPEDLVTGSTDCEPTLCGTNFNVVSNVCTACASGTTNGAGNDASGPNTICTATLCGPNENVVSNVCTACASGTTNIAGDDASGQDTECCAANQYVSNNVCTACVSQTGCATDAATCSTESSILTKLQCTTASDGYYVAAASQVVTACDVSSITNAATVTCAADGSTVVVATCNAGYYGAVGSTACGTCTGGTSGTTGSTGMTSCSDCGAGFGVKSGSGQSAGSAGYCEACTHNNANAYDFNIVTDSTPCGNSQTCAVGKGFTAGSASAEGSCADCTAAAAASCDSGAVNPAGTGCNTGGATFTAAVAATYSGANSHGACHTVAANLAFVWKDKNSVECAAGYTGTPTYDANDGSYSSGCTACVVGKSKSTTGSAVCTACADGTYQDETGKTSCKNVDNGKFGSADGSSYTNSGAKSQHDCAAGSFSDYSTDRTGGCDACDNGKFQGSAGQDSCDDIPNGKFGSKTGSRGTSVASKAAYSGGTGATKAYECYPGTVNVNGDGDCTACVAGTYQPSSGQTSCSNVPAGSEGSKTDLDNGEIRCHTTCTGATGTQACTGATGSYKGFSGGLTGECSACAHGNEPNSNKDACQKCNEGSYNADGYECVACAKNKYSTAKEATVCIDVQAGQEPQVSGAVTASGADSAVYCANTDYQTTDTVYSISGVQVCKPVPAGQKGSTVNNVNSAAIPGFSALSECGNKNYRLAGTDATSCTALLDGEGCTERTAYDSATFTSTTHTDVAAQETKCSAKADCGVNQYRATTDSDATCYILGAGKECKDTRSGNAVDKDTTDCKEQIGCQTAGYYSNAVTFAVSSKANLCQECSDDFGVGAWNDDDQAGCGECIPGYGVGGGVAGVTCEQCVFEEYNAVTSNSVCVNMNCSLGKGIVSNPGQLEDHNNCTDCVKPFFSESALTGVCEELHCAPGFWFNWTDTSTRPTCVQCDTGYALVSTSNHQNETCVAHTTCPATQGQDVVPDHKTDRTCQVCAVDTHPFGANINASYSNVNDGTNCVDSLGACGTNQYYVPGNATHDRECKSCAGTYAVKNKASHHDLHCEVLVAEARVAGLGTVNSVKTGVETATEALLSGAGVAVREAKTLSDPYGRRVEVTDDGTNIVVKVWLDDVLADGTTPAIEDENKAVVDKLVVSGATVSFANSACYTWAPKDGSISQNTGCHPVLGNGEHCSPVCASGYSLVSNSTCVGGVYTAAGCLSPDESKLSFAVELMDKVKLATTPKDRIAIMKTKSGLTHAEKRKTIQYLFTEESGNFELDLDDSLIGTAFKTHLQAESKTKLTYIKLKSKANDQDCTNADVDINNTPDAWVLSVSESETGLICKGSGSDLYKKPVATIKWNRQQGGNDIYDISCWSSFLQQYTTSFEKADGTSFDCTAEYSNSPTFWVGSLSSSTCKPVATRQGSIMRLIGNCPTTLQTGQTCQPTCPGYYYMDTVGSCDAAGNYVEPECKYSCDETISLWRSNGCCSADKDDTCKLLKQRFKNHNCCP